MAGENEQIVRRFFDRQPEDKMFMTSGAGTREMYEQGIDFVDKEMERALSMGGLLPKKVVHLLS